MRAWWAPAWPETPVNAMPNSAVPPQDEDRDLPPCPERPDCCFGGCAVCVLDGYEEEVEAWRQRVEQIRAQRRASAVPPASG